MRKTLRKTNKKAKRSRVNIPKATRIEVVRKCRRHCCMCFGLRTTLEVTDGQIAHLDRDKTNAELDNLAYLCLACHKVYDSNSNRVLGYTAEEIRLYRTKLYAALGSDQFEWTLTVRADRSEYDVVTKAINKAHSVLRDRTNNVDLKVTSLE